MTRVPVKKYVRRRIRPTVERTHVRLREPRKPKFIYSKTVGAVIKAPEISGSQVYGRVGPEDPALFVGRDVWRESAASTVDDLLGFDIVPPTVLRTARPHPKVPYYDPRSDVHRLAKRVSVSVQQAIPDTYLLYDVIGLSSDDLEDMEPEELEDAYNDLIRSGVDKDNFIKVTLFDLILSHGDRHTSNILVDKNRGPDGKKHLYAIDNEAILLGFPPDFEWHATWKMVVGKPIPDAIRKQIRSVIKGDFYAALAGIEPYYIERAWKRKQWAEKLTHIPFKTPYRLEDE